MTEGTAEAKSGTWICVGFIAGEMVGETGEFRRGVKGDMTGEAAGDGGNVVRVDTNVETIFVV